MKMTSENKKYRLGTLDYLTITFITLKLTGFVDFTWWQTFSPAIIAASAGVIQGIIESISENSQKDKEHK